MTRHLRVGLLAFPPLCFRRVSGGRACAAADRPPSEPSIGIVPNGPSDVQETHDEVSIRQIMKLVQLSRIMGGGITQMLTTIISQKTALDEIRDAQTGRKPVPLLNGPAEVMAREGGEGLRQMTQGALDGAAEDRPTSLPLLTRSVPRSRSTRLSPLRTTNCQARKCWRSLQRKAPSQAPSPKVRIRGPMQAWTASTDTLRLFRPVRILKTSVDLNTAP